MLLSPDRGGGSSFWGGMQVVRRVCLWKLGCWSSYLGRLFICRSSLTRNEGGVMEHRFLQPVNLQPVFLQIQLLLAPAPAISFCQDHNLQCYGTFELPVPNIVCILSLCNTRGVIYAHLRHITHMWQIIHRTLIYDAASIHVYAVRGERVALSHNFLVKS